ncbi:MAG: hypothetical protein GXO87_04185 [Chlorobi bacterium]|nr:hypothetical protein [Chlorobiota bacterium]
MINLNGKWKYLIDPNPGLSFGAAEKKIAAEKYDGEINVPSNWNESEFENYSGALWYVKEFDLPENNRKRKLVFDGVDYFTDVWLNGKFIGSHEGYFSRFSFDLTNDIFKRKGNRLIVKVASPVEEAGNVWPDRKKLIKGIFNHHDCRPGGWDLKRGQDKNTGGIWNSVKVIKTKDISIENVKVESKIFDDFAEIKIYFEYVSFYSLAKKNRVNIAVKSPSGKIIAAKRNIVFEPGGGTAIVVIKIEEPELWFPYELGKPSLYELKISSKIFYTVKNKFGIREVSLSEKNEFIINGKRFFLRGTNIIPEQFLSSLSKKRIKKLTENLLEANVNIVRVHAHVNRKELYDAFDEAGILVWQDFALQWTYDESNEFKENAVRQIKDMVRGLFNHPSVVFWCCHNEPGGQINTLDNYLFDAVREEDGTRIIRKASNYEEHPYDGWYWGKAEHFSAAPMGPLVTEFGAQALPNVESLRKILSEKDISGLNWEEWEYHNFQYEQTFNVAEVEIGKNIEEFVNNSQKYQAELISKAVDYYRRKKWNGITGIFQFMFVDCWEAVTWSVVDYFGKKKAGFYALKKAFEPLFLSIDLKKEKYQIGEELFFETRIINDLPRKIISAELEICLNEKKVAAIKEINIQEDSTVFLPFDKFKIKLDGFGGKTELKLKLIDSVGKVLSENEKELEIIEHKIKWM